MGVPEVGRRDAISPKGCIGYALDAVGPILVSGSGQYCVAARPVQVGVLDRQYTAGPGGLAIENGAGPIAPVDAPFGDGVGAGIGPGEIQAVRGAFINDVAGGHRERGNDVVTVSVRWGATAGLWPGAESVRSIV